MDIQEMCFMDFKKIDFIEMDFKEKTIMDFEIYFKEKILMDFKNVDLKKKKYISVKSI